MMASGHVFGIVCSRRVHHGVSQTSASQIARIGGACNTANPIGHRKNRKMATGVFANVKLLR
jgi:hypothetical protein